jgi:hypothetical protein
MAKQTKLIQGYSQTSVGKNIGYLAMKHPAQSHAQDIAIALNVALDAAKAAHKPAMVRKYTQKK